MMAFVLGELIAVYGNLVIIAAGVLLFAWIVFKVIARDKMMIDLVMILLLLGAGIVRTQSNMKVISQCSQIAEDEMILIEGSIYKIEEKTNRTFYYIKNDKRLNKVIAVLDSDSAAGVGDQVSIWGKYNSFHTARNKGNYDEESYYHSIGVFGKVTDCNITVVTYNKNPVEKALFFMKTILRDSINEICSQKEANLYYGILLGDKGDIDNEIKNLYRTNGISHILSISGLHVGIIGMTIFRQLRRLCSYRVSATGAVLLIIAFGIMVGSGSSTIRAVIMLIVNLGAKVYGRTYDGISSLALAILLLLFSNPFYLFNSGLQLSVAAMAGVLVICPIITRFLNIKNRIAKSVLLSAAITMATLPIIALNYYELPTYSIVINLIVIPLMSIVVLSGIAGSCIAVINILLGRILIAPGVFTLKAYEIMCSLFDKIPFNTIVTGEPDITAVGLYYAVLAIFLVIMIIIIHKKDDKEQNLIEWWWIRYSKNLFALLSCVILFLLIYLRKYNGLEITFIDVGQGDGIFIRNNQGVTFLIDGGSSNVTSVGKYRIEPFIKANGVSEIDYAILTHSDKDHYSGLLELMDGSNTTIRIKHLVMADIEEKTEDYKEIVQLAESKGIPVLYIYKGIVIQEGELTLEVLHPEIGYFGSSTNDYSIVLKLIYSNFTAYFTGDLEEQGESEIIMKNLFGNCNLLKVAHHGSKNSTSQDFLELIKPQISIISAGENNSYGHPHKELLQRLESVNSNIIGTYQYGGITLLVHKDEIRIQKYRDKINVLNR